MSRRERPPLPRQRQFRLRQRPTSRQIRPRRFTRPRQRPPGERAVLRKSKPSLRVDSMKLATERHSAMMKRLLIALAPLALCMALAFGCGRSQSDDGYPAEETASLQPPLESAATPVGSTVESAPTPTVSAAVRAVPPTPTPPQPPPPLLVPTPTPTVSDAVVPYLATITPSLDELILHSDVIAWVRPPAVTNTSKTIPSGRRRRAHIPPVRRVPSSKSSNTSRGAAGICWRWSLHMDIRT